MSDPTFLTEISTEREAAVLRYRGFYLDAHMAEWRQQVKSIERGVVQSLQGLADLIEQTEGTLRGHARDMSKQTSLQSC